jgi:hypothetical protein
VATTGGERAADGFRGDRAIFFDVAHIGGCRKGSGGSIDDPGTSRNGFGCWEDGAKGLSSIGGV